jgi:glutathione peroxidase
MSIYSFEVKTINGNKEKLEKYKGKVLLIVNTATNCGLAPQFRGLQDVYLTYQSKGFEVLGFPSNQFLGQEPRSEKEITEYCDMNYQITFPMYSKIDVNGKNADPLYAYLRNQTNPFFFGNSIKWNFTKFLINRDGKVVRRYAPNTKPEEIKADIEKIL